MAPLPSSSLLSAIAAAAAAATATAAAQSPVGSQGSNTMFVVAGGMVCVVFVLSIVGYFYNGRRRKAESQPKLRPLVLPSLVNNSPTSSSRACGSPRTPTTPSGPQLLYSTNISVDPYFTSPEVKIYSASDSYVTLPVAKSNREDIRPSSPPPDDLDSGYQYSHERNDVCFMPNFRLSTVEEDEEFDDASLYSMDSLDETPITPNFQHLSIHLNIPDIAVIEPSQDSSYDIAGIATNNYNIISTVVGSSSRYGDFLDIPGYCRVTHRLSTAELEVESEPEPEPESPAVSHPASPRQRPVNILRYVDKNTLLASPSPRRVMTSIEEDEEEDSQEPVDQESVVEEQVIVEEPRTREPVIQEPLVQDRAVQEPVRVQETTQVHPPVSVQEKTSPFKRSHRRGGTVFIEAASHFFGNITNVRREDDGAQDAQPGEDDIPETNEEEDSAKWTPKNGQIVLKVLVPSTDDIWRFKVPEDISLQLFTEKVTAKLGFPIAFSPDHPVGTLEIIRTDEGFRLWLANRIRNGHNYPIIAHAS